MQFKHILFEEKEGVATLTINRPHRLNSLDRDTAVEMRHALDLVRDGHTNARCLVLTGVGHGFSTGADLPAETGTMEYWDEGGPVDAGEILELYLNPLVERFFALPIPFVTAVNGVAVGAGCSFALAGDIILAARSAYFMQSFARVGLVPDTGSTWLLPRLIGRARASRMLMLGERVGAEQAFSWGMVSEVVDDEQLQDRALEVARKLARGPTKAFAMIRHGIRQCMELSLTEALQLERRYQLDVGRTKDFFEGVNAHLEKRAPNFSGE